MKPRNYFPQKMKHGYAPAWIEDGGLHIEGYPGTVRDISACVATCERYNRDQIESARKALAEAQAHMDAVIAVFELGRPRSDVA